MAPLSTNHPVRPDTIVNISREATTIVNTYTIKSHTNPTLSYTVTFPDTGDPTCECKGYGYRRTCSHIKEALQTLEADLRTTLQALQPHRQATSPTLVYYCRVCGAELSGTHTFTGKCVACTRKETFHHAI